MTQHNANRIKLDQAEAGMVLAAAILDDKRGVLLPDGTVLTDSAIASLRRRGIGSLSVAGEELPAPALQAAREQAQARLQHLFRKSGAAEPARSLLHCLSRYREE